jgi:hypothetical protein
VRLAELLQQQEEDLQRDCTFKPQINQHPSHEQRGDFLAETQLQERRKRLQQMLASDNDAKNDAVVRTLRSAVSGSSQSSPPVSNTGHRSPATSLQFSPALSRAASIVGVGGVEGGKASVAAHGRHEDPDFRGEVEVNAAAAVGAVEKVLDSLFVDDQALAASLMLSDLQILVAPPVELPESDDDFQNGSDNDNHDHRDDMQEQRYRRGGVRGSTVVAAVSASDEHSVLRLNARLQHEKSANQAAPSSRSIRTPKFFNPRPSLVVARGNPAPVTPSLKQQLRHHSAPRPSSAPARGKEARDEAFNESSAGVTVRSRALPSRISNATAVALAASMQTAETFAANDQKLERKRIPSSLQHIPSTPSQNSSNSNQNLQSLLYKDAEFRTLRRQLLGVQQELIMEQSATP